LGLKVDQISTIEVDVKDLSDMHCFSHVRRASHSVLKIIQALFPTLQNKSLKYFLEITDGHQMSKSTTVFYWFNAKLQMNYSVTTHWLAGRSFFRHTFTFSANSDWVDEREEDIKVIERIRVQNFMLPFAMGGHNRLGASSPIKALNSDDLRLIGKHVNGTLY